MENKCNWCATCWCFAATLLWLAGLVSLIFAWISTGDIQIFGMDTGFWFGTAITLGILAVPVKLKCACHDCKMTRPHKN